MAKTTATRARRSKAETQQEFEDIRRQAAAERETADARADETARLKEAEVRQAVEGVTVERVIQDLAAVGLHVSKALGDLSARLAEEVGRLSAVREAVAIEQRELERLHRLDVVATTIGQLLQEHEAKRLALQREVAEARDAWEAESKERERADKEFEDTLKKQRQREAEDYEYRKALERKKAQDKYDEDVRLREKQNREKQEALVKSWDERESGLKAQEGEMERLKKEVETFPQRLKQEVDRAIADARRQGAQALEQQLLLASKDAAADTRVAELQIKTHEETIARQAEQIAALQKQMEEAKRQVQDIAVKAIDGASG
ncbi:MAG: hypothetical protein IMZ55_03375, partial [Acidobacteria bacterium]|nr:hypothetical protein [Acidobacteriota bacterium]